jgi:PAS domain S-box-containing protein
MNALPSVMINGKRCIAACLEMVPPAGNPVLLPNFCSTQTAYQSTAIERIARWPWPSDLREADGVLMSAVASSQRFTWQRMIFWKTVRTHPMARIEGSIWQAGVVKRGAACVMSLCLAFACLCAEANPDRLPGTEQHAPATSQSIQANDSGCTLYDCEEQETGRHLSSAGEHRTTDPSRHHPSELTAEQRQWLAKLPEMKVGYETDRYPYSFTDEKGQFSGIAADYFHVLHQKLGLRFKMIPAENWAQLKKMVADHQVDLIATGNSDDFSSQDMIFSQPYETFPGVIVTRINSASLTGPDDLERRSVTIREEQSLLAQARVMLKGSHLIPVGTNEAGLALVADGGADAYIGTLPAIDTLIRNRYAARLRVTGPAGMELDLALGIRPSYAELIPYINRELNKMSAGQRQAIRARWLTSSYHYGVPRLWVLCGSIIALLLFGIGGLAYYQLRRASQAQMLAEKKLAEELDFQQALLETLPYPVFVKDAEGRYLTVNEAYEKAYGVSRSELFGRTIRDIRHIEFFPTDLLHEGDMRAIQTGKSERIEVTRASKKGGGTTRSEIFWRRPFTGESFHKTRMLGTIVDVSDIRNAEARAKASEQRLSDITEAMPAVVFQLHVSPDGSRHFTYVGGDSQSLLGLSGQEIVESEAALFDRIHPEDQQRIPDVVSAAADHLRPVRSFDLRVKVDGQWRWFRTEGGIPRRREDGAVEWSGYWIDTTLAHLQEQELREAKAQAESAAAAKSAFLATMSHEIRTPMAGVVGLIELLSRKVVDAEQSQMLGMAQDSAKMLLQILDDILDYSRIEANRIDLENSAFDIHQLLDSVAGLFSISANSKGLRLYCVHDSELGREFLGDPLRIRQIITNLISNALKFTDAGQIILRVSPERLSGGKAVVRFTVTDTGIGIAPDKLGRLFQRFTQAEQSTTRRFGGTGLGLTISRRLAELMEGQLYLKSSPGHGTQATLEIPLALIRPMEPHKSFVGKVAAVLSNDGDLATELRHALTAFGFNTSHLRSTDVDDCDVQADLIFVDDECSSLASDHSGRIDIIHGTIHAPHGRPVLKAYPVVWGSLWDVCCQSMGLQTGREPSAIYEVELHHDDVHVLVAEDHPINRKLIGKQLEELGYKHVMVADGREALTVLRKQRFDVILTDCDMPYVDGFELTRQIREMQGGGPQTPIIALSASAFPEQIKACVEAGMDDFLAKPVSLRDLGSKIAAMTKRHAAAEAISVTANLDDRAAHLIDFYKDKNQLKVLLTELLSMGKRDLDAFDCAVRQADEHTQRYLLHRMEGALSMVDPQTATRANPDVGAEERIAIVRENLAGVAELLQRLH